ncbi:hypothetical protein LTR53_019989, partial [Teratosphaeriaceae sp. CCFEE 6253]
VDELTEADQIAANQQLQFLPLLRPLFSFPRWALVLQPHPELVHLHEVRQYEADAVLQIALRSTTRTLAISRTGR